MKSAGSIPARILAGCRREHARCTYADSRKGCCNTGLLTCDREQTYSCGHILPSHRPEICNGGQRPGGSPLRCGLSRTAPFVSALCLLPCRSADRRVLRYIAISSCQVKKPDFSVRSRGCGREGAPSWKLPSIFSVSVVYDTPSFGV